ncbi:EboA domain-containing protein [Streptomyces sp. CA-132043]|uniref:EboA domain-containing protein n=1 Tax=Streptomyces sp. CA-132043 TaxID=3240048 RepID=UPI003D90CECF
MTPDDAWIARLDKALRDRLGGDARAWLDEALAEATAHAAVQAPGRAATDATGGAATDATAQAATQATGRPATDAFAQSAANEANEANEAPGAGTPAVWEMRFASAGRWCVREESPHHTDPEATEAARVLILCTARADGPTVTRLYEHGTAAERRAVLLALPQLPLGTGGRAGLPLIEDALRTNDTRLVAAAVGPYAARHLDAHAWRHAVLKCLFTGVPVDAVAGLAERSRGDAELARMLGDYARERTSAGRPVPDDLPRVLALTQMSPLSADASAGRSVSPSVSPPGNPSTGPSTGPPAESSAGPSDTPSRGSSVSPSPGPSSEEA